MDKKLLRKIVFGTWSVSGDFKKVVIAKSIKLLRYVYLNGIREFDTAPNYGAGFSEKLLGKAFENYKKKPLINTKFGQNHIRIKEFNIKSLSASLNQSLKNLKVKKINTLFLHNPRKIKNLDQIIKYLKYLKKKKIISNYGISIAKDFDYSSNFINKFKIVQLDHNIIFIKNKFNKIYKNKTVYSRSPLASGTLVNNFKKKIFYKKDIRSSWLNERRKQIINKQINFLERLFKKDIFSLSINYLLNDSFCKKCIYGFRTIKQFKEFKNTLSKIKKFKLDFNNFDKIYSQSKIFQQEGF
jgi:aryl-alcohol dehydrogenase-like predicted oxidoreductase